MLPPPRTYDHTQCSGFRSIQRMKTFYAEMWESVQQTAFWKLVSGARHFRETAPEGHQRYALLGLQTSWDGATQVFRSSKASRKRSGAAVAVDMHSQTASLEVRTMSIETTVTTTPTPTMPTPPVHDRRVGVGQVAAARFRAAAQAVSDTIVEKVVRMRRSELYHCPQRETSGKTPRIYGRWSNSTFLSRSMTRVT